MRTRVLTVATIVLLLLAVAVTAHAAYVQSQVITIFADGTWYLVDDAKGGEIEWTPDSTMYVGPGPVTITIEADSGTIVYRGYAHTTSAKAIFGKASVRER